MWTDMGISDNVCGARRIYVCGAWAVGWRKAGHAPVIDLQDRQVRRGTDGALRAVVRVRVADVVVAPLGEVLPVVLG